jgi:hypothetical protein
VGSNPLEPFTTAASAGTVDRLMTHATFAMGITRTRTAAGKSRCANVVQAMTLPQAH